jgi:hypothetical protein
LLLCHRPHRFLTLLLLLKISLLDPLLLFVLRIHPTQVVCS